VLLATIGGFGLLVASVLPQIRSYNRISLFVGFFSLVALALALEKGQERFANKPAGRWLWRVGLGLLLIIGVLDQTPKHAFHMTPTWANDKAFVETLEAELPAGAMIYQLPYRVFPEGSRYDHLRLYVHSKNLRWSYPVMRSRPTDFWHKELAAKPVDDMLPILAFAGFEGVCIDRSDDLGDADLEKKLAKRLHVSPLVSADKRFAYYPLRDFTQTMKAQYSAEEWRRLQDQTLHPVVISWLRGFVRTPEMYPKDGRWCCSTGTMQLCNLGQSTQKVRVTLSLRSGFANPANLRIDGPLWQGETTINDQHGEIGAVLDVPPGRHAVNFSCDAAYFDGNARRVFRVVDFKIRPEPIQ
jgi:phosphoglycerol transferase